MFRKRYDRSLQPATNRSSRTDKCPPEIALKIKNASLQKKAITSHFYFQLYMECGGDWAQVEIKEKMLTIHSKTLYGKCRWLMKFELERLYPDFLVDAICKSKMKDSTQWRPNPDVPELESAIQYKCRIEEGEDWSEEQRRE